MKRRDWHRRKMNAGNKSVKVGRVVGLIFFALLFAGCQTFSAETRNGTNANGSNLNRARIYKNRSPFIEREVFDAKKSPALAAVGRLAFIGQTWCSITLVGADIGVTAGHCFLDTNVKFDLTQDFKPYQTSVIFKPDGVRRLENISIARILKVQRSPDYVIVKLSRKIAPEEIKPLKIVRLTNGEMIAREERLGCAGFNGDKKLGERGLVMTISRNIRINPKLSRHDRIETNCFSSKGGSGGLFFEEKRDAENESVEYDLLGVIWGATDGEANERGVYIEDRNVSTSITPARNFYDELTKIISEN